MSASKRAREISIHCPLTKARDGAAGRQVWAMLLLPLGEGDSMWPSAPSKDCRVTLGRRWAASTAEEEKDKGDDLDGSEMLSRRGGGGGWQGQGQGWGWAGELRRAGRGEKVVLDREGV